MGRKNCIVKNEQFIVFPKSQCVNSNLEPPPIYDRNTKNKAEELDRLHAAMKKKSGTTSNTEKLQILTLVPDFWSQKYCSEYFGVSEYLIRYLKGKKLHKMKNDNYICHATYLRNNIVYHHGFWYTCVK